MNETRYTAFDCYAQYLGDVRRVFGHTAAPGPLAEYLFRGNADDTSGHGRHGVVSVLGVAGAEED